METKEYDDDIWLEYKCLDCGEYTTEYRRLQYKGVIRNSKYETYKCPYCRGNLEKVSPIGKRKQIVIVERNIDMLKAGLYY